MSAVRVYHATEYSNLDSILEKGILTGWEGCVYVCKKPEEAVRFLAVHLCTHIAVFEFEVDESELEESFDHNEEFFKCKAYIINRPINNAEILDAYEYTIGQK